MNKSNTDLALLLVRVGLCLVFLSQGLDRLQVVDPSILFNFITGIEMLGAICMLTGFFTSWAGLLLAAVMIGIVEYNFDLMVFLSSIAIALAGPGTYTFTNIFGKKK